MIKNIFIVFFKVINDNKKNSGTTEISFRCYSLILCKIHIDYTFRNKRSYIIFE